MRRLIFFKRNKILILLIILGFFCHMTISFPSGSFYCREKECGLFFWGAHEHDAIWHLAIIEAAFKKIPPQHPIFAGESLTGYNYFLDFFIFLLSKTGIPAIIWYFKILPFIWFVLYTFLSLKLATKISSNYWFRIFFLFFNYFGASFGVIFTLFHKKTIWGSSSSLAMQPLLSLVNPQFAFSLIFIMLILLNFFEVNQKKRILNINFVYVIVNFGLKFYAGVISFFLVFLFLILEKNSLKQKFFEIFKLISFTFISIFIFYQPFSSEKTGSPLIFSPFSMVHHIIEERNLFYLPGLVNARYYLYQFGWGPRLILIELISVFLFIFFNFGARFFGLVYFVFLFLKKHIEKSFFILFLSIVFSIFLTVFFIQKGIWWNSIQFTYYGLFLSNIFISLLLKSLIVKRKKIPILLVFILILVNIPENFDILRSFYSIKNASFIPQDELEALKFLKKQKDGVVLSLDLEKKSIINNNLNTSYITAFSGKISYLANELQLIVTGIDFNKRFEDLKDGRCYILSRVDYIYLKHGHKIEIFSQCPKKFHPIFKNKLVEIIKVN